MEPRKAFQDGYPEDFSHCYGCGNLNPHGLQIKSFWDGDESVAVFEPEPYHTAFPGYVYGGLIASLIDCHSTATAAAAECRARGTEMDPANPVRYVTASLHVDYLKPTPIGDLLHLRGRVFEVKGRKVVVDTDLSAGGRICAQGRVVAVRMPDNMLNK